MNILFSGDWQATGLNLDKIDALTKRVLQWIKKYKVKALVHTGDLKDTYNPVDVRVINASIKLIKEVRAAGCEFLINFGNHDGLSMSGNDNWFPALKAAGAICFNRVGYVDLKDGTRLHFVPYRRNVKEAREMFREAARNATKNSLLVFHHEIIGTKFNAHSEIEEGVTVEHLRLEKYRYAFGGHIHRFQRIADNCIYVGSPFAHRWDEVNEDKYCVLWKDRKVRLLRAGMPRFFDPTLPGFQEVDSWTGHNVRVRVGVPEAGDAAAALLRATKRAQRAYPGAVLHVVPERSDVETVDPGGQEESRDLLREYVKLNYKGEYRKAVLRAAKEALAGEFTVTLNPKPIRLIEAEAKNVLSFRHVHVRYSKGIEVISGRNEDWPGRVNGIGKTNYTQLPLLALFGETSKGQKTDSWRRKGSEGESWVRLRFKLHDGRTVDVRRSRSPSLELRIDGKEVSTGIGSAGTQERIAKLVGFSATALKSSSYVDPVFVSAVLGGTPAERQGVFSRALGMESLEKAAKLAGARLAELSREQVQLQIERGKLRAAAEGITEAYEYEKTRRVDTDALTATIVECRRRLNKKLVAKLPLKPREEDPVEGLGRKLAYAESDCDHYHKQIRNLARLEDTRCNECGQKVTAKHCRLRIGVYTKRLHQATARFKKLNKLAAESQKARKLAMAEYERRMKEYHEAKVRLSIRQTKLEAEIDKAETALEEEARRRKRRDVLRQQAKANKADLVTNKERLREVTKQLEIWTFVSKMVSRKGIPLFVTARLCAVLNAVTKTYSDLLTDGVIQVSFQVENGAIVPVVTNSQGGDGLKDQSRGEGRLAGLVCSLSLHAVTRLTNVLVLDEPTEGLDAHNSGVLVEAVNKMRKMGCVQVITHNPEMASAIKADRLVTIVKKGGVSRAK